MFFPAPAHGKHISIGYIGYMFGVVRMTCFAASSIFLERKNDEKLKIPISGSAG